MATLLQYESEFDHMRRATNDIQANIEQMKENVGELLDVVAKNKFALQQMSDVLNRQLKTQERTLVLLQEILNKLD